MNHEQQQKLHQLITRCGMDEALKQQVLTNPIATLTAHGIDIPTGVEVRVLENTATVYHLVIPVFSNDLSDEELDHVVGGTGDVLLGNAPDRLSEGLGSDQLAGKTRFNASR